MGAFPTGPWVDRAVALSGDTLFVGGNREWVGVYVRDGASWSEHQVITPPGASETFGMAVGVLGDLALIGAKGDSQAGAAYVLVRNGDGWNEQAKLTPPSNPAEGSFGASTIIAVPRGCISLESVGARG